MNLAKNAFLGTAVALALAAAAPVGSAAGSPSGAVAQDTRRESADEALARDRAREVVRRENENVRRRARIERLMSIYERRGQSDRVATLRAMHERDEAGHRAAMARLEQDLGAGRYERLRNSMRGQLIARAQAQQQQRERAAAASREPRGAETRYPASRTDTRSAYRPAPRPAPRSGGRP